jgi:hypothetical protein
MKQLILCAALAMIGCSAFSQEFRYAAGIRAGYTGGVEFRIYTDELNSYKFLLGSRDNGAVIHALKEFHQPGLFSFTDQLNFVYGGGLHVGYERWNRRYYRTNSSYYVTNTDFIAGIDGLAGLEYMFAEVPLSLGIEAKPYFDLFGREVFDLELFDFAFTIKYHF